MGAPQAHAKLGINRHVNLAPLTCFPSFRMGLRRTHGNEEHDDVGLLIKLDSAHSGAQALSEQDVLTSL